MRQRLSANSPFLPKTATEDCLKCLLKVPHKKCESHKYIRVGGGYRHGYWYVKCLLEELELQRQRELIMKQRLESIREKQMKAIKTYIRTKSGRIIEKIIFLSEEDYEAFKEGKNVEELLKKYLSKDEAKGLQSWDKDEVKAIKTMVRTKSGRLIEKLVYVSKEDYDAITAGKVDAKELLKKYAKDGEVIEGWKEAAMKTIKTYVRTKSGRLIEKTIMISQEDYDAMIKEGKNPDDILKKYITLEEGQQLESWKSAEPMKAIKTKIRTKSGRIIEKTIYVSADDYDKMMAGGGDPNEILKKYMGEDEGTIEGWSKADPTPMKVVKTYVRTKSGRLIEKVIMLTEDEYKQFVEAGGDPEFLKKFIQLEKGEVIDSWEKASTVYSGGSDHEMIQKAKVGERIVGKDGAVYEIVVDPLTGKKYKKKIESDVDSGIASMQKGKKGRKGKGGKGGFDSDEETPEERRRRKAGNRDPDSGGSAYSYRSVVSAGGTRHVRRRRKREDGTYSDSASYHSSQDEEGQARRRRRRRERKHGPDSANSYYSVVSEGGTRHVKRRRKRGDGTYSRSVSYHSSDSGKEGGRLADKKKKKRREHGPDSDYSYESEVSAGGTRTRKRKKKIRDAKGNVIGYGSSESYTSDDESVYTTVSDGKGGKIRVKKEKPGRGGKGGKGGAGKGGKGKKKLEPVFSDCTTDDDDVDLENMTEEEKKAYFKAKAERAAAREKRRREKYGDKYDEMMSKHQDFKKAKAKEKMKAKRLQELREKGLISPSSDWTIDSDTGEPLRKAEKAKVLEQKKQKKLQELREKGLISPSSDWTLDSDGEPVRISELIKQGKRKPEDYKKGGKGRRKGKDGNDADDESDSGESAIDSVTGEKIRRKKRTGSEAEYEYEYDDQGRVIRKTRKGHKPGDDGSDYEYEYDSDGNVKMTKKKGVGAKKGKKGEDDSDEEQFEVGPDGKIRLKKGKKKIDIDKLTADDLRKLGIDPNLSKEEIAKKLQEKFGDDVKIFQGKKKIPTKRASEYGSDARSSDLAKDSDLDVDTLVGTKRVNVKMKKGGQALLDHMKSILNMSELKDAEAAKDLDEKGDIDFVSHYRLVDPSKIEGYARAFVVEDDDMDQVLSYKESRTALNGIPTIQQMTTKQLEYVLKVLNLDDASQITFRMFAVVSALCERVTSMDSISKHLLEICDLLDIQRKMGLYKAMFYCNVESDRTSNFIKADSLRIELIAGGLNWKQQEHVMARLHPNVYNEISFLDYLVYVPLFLSMHDNIVDNPLDMSDQKYNQKLRQLSGGTRQRDMNPLGMPLKKTSTFQLRKQAQDLIEGKIDPKKMKEEKVEILNKYATLPNILEENENKRKLSVPTKSTTPPMQMVY